MENNYIIKKMQLCDVNEILEIESSLDNKILTKNSLLEDLQNEHYCYFTLNMDNKIIGYIGNCIIQDSMDIISIVISKEYQRNGFGSILLEYILDFAKEQKIENILLEVRVSNIPAQNLYKKHNFKLINTRKKYYPDNLEDAYVFMYKI